MIKRLLSIIFIAGILIGISPRDAFAQITEADFGLIRDVIAKYEAAYSRKDLKAIAECCDKDAEWFHGLEAEIGKEFARYKYLRVSSTEKRIMRDPNSKSAEDVVCLRRALYIAYKDSETPGVGIQGRSAALNEFDAVYFLNRSPKDGSWKIKAFGESPCDEQLEYIKAKGLIGEGKADEALRSLKRVIDINPLYSIAYSTLSDLSFALGKIDDSLQYAETAVSLRPDVAYYNYSLGMVYLSMKDKEKAITALEKARELDDDFPDVDYYIQNADSIMTVTDSISRTRTINEKISKVLAIGRETKGDVQTIKDLNLIIRKPNGWRFIPAAGWHVLVAMSPVANPVATDPVATISIKPMQKDEKAQDVNDQAARTMASSLNNNTIIRLGDPVQVVIAGSKAVEDLFAFIVNDVQMLVLVATFTKDSIAYTIVYSERARSRDDMRIDARAYKEIIAGLGFIDPREDVSDKIRKMLENKPKK